MTKNKLLLSTLLLGVLGVGILGASTVRATDTTNWHQNLISKLATKFNVSESAVQSVFDENRKEHQTRMTQNLTERLTQSVKDGKITEAQKQAILDKHAKMQQERESDLQNWQNMTQEQRRAARESRRTEMEQWAQDNNLDLTVLREFLHEFGGPGMKMGHGRGGMM